MVVEEVVIDERCFGDLREENRKYYEKKDKEIIISILGDGVKKIQPNEYITINAQKKSLYAKKLINKGDKFSINNLCIASCPIV